MAGHARLILKTKGAMNCIGVNNERQKNDYDLNSDPDLNFNKHITKTSFYIKKKAIVRDQENLKPYACCPECLSLRE